MRHRVRRSPLQAIVFGVCAAFGVAVAPMAARAELVQFDITSVRPAFDGASFGATGAYEEVRAIAHYKVDPKAPINAGLVNIQKAPKQSDGRIAFDADVLIYRPVSLHKANGRVIFEMANRGHGLALGNTSSMPGDGFLMRHGYTLVIGGWQPDYPIRDLPAMKVAIGSRLSLGSRESDLVTARLPVATNNDGSPVTGLTREQFYDVGAGSQFTGYLAYPAADVNAKAKLTVREVWSGASVSPAAMTYRYIDPWRVEITKPPGVTDGALYEFIYTAKDPIVYGLGLAAARDLVSFLRYDSTKANPLLADGRTSVQAVIGYGASQTGRVMKELLYEFNTDEKGRVLFEGIMAHISGAGRNAANTAFARPGSKDGGHTAWGMHGDDFPFSYPITYDPLSRKTDGLLARCLGDGKCPKVMHLDSEQELWQGGSLTFVDTGGRDLKMPDNVRVYDFAGTEHAAQPRGVTAPICSIPASSSISWSSFDRALLLALDDWATRGIAPPPNSYPTLASGQLVDVSQYKFPKFAALPYPAPFAEKYLLDFSQEPPERLIRYPALVPKPDADGNMIGGVRHPFMSVPLSTNTGWNTRKAGFGAGGMCVASGLSIPFAATREQRLAAGDTRLSVAERYKDEADYVARVGKAADALVRQRFLTAEDAAAIKKEASLRYAKAMKASP